MAVSALQGPLFPNAFDGMDGRQKELHQSVSQYLWLVSRGKVG